MYLFGFPSSRFGEVIDLLNLPTGHVCGLRSHYLDVRETIVEFYVFSYTALSKDSETQMINYKCNLILSIFSLIN